MKNALLFALLLASATVTASLAADLNTFTLRGRLAALEYRAVGGVEFRAYATLYQDDGSGVYGLTVRCPNPTACHSLESLFLCTPSYSSFTDPDDNTVAVTYAECSTFTWNECVFGQGRMANLGNPTTHRSEIVADGLEASKLCTAR